MRQPARFKHILLSILLIIASISVTKTTLQIYKSSQRLDLLKDEISELEIKADQLESSIEYKKTADYIEEKARNELNMVKPGESVYVVAGLSDTVDKTATVEVDDKPKPFVLGLSNIRGSKKTFKERMHNLGLWWDFLF